MASNSVDGTPATDPAQVLILPGWLNSGPGHWQTLWEAAQPGIRRVDQSDWEWPRRGDWMARLDEEVQAHQQAKPHCGPLLLAAHSLGCHLVAAWAAHSTHTAAVHGALLVAPPNLEHEDTPPQVSTWRPVQRQRLPFASVLVLSDNDPYCSETAGLALAAAWGSRVVRLPGAGHINAESGLGDWPQGLALLRDLGEPGAPA